MNDDQKSAVRAEAAAADEQPQAKRGRSKKEKARRSFAKELHELQVRVINALYLLRRSQGNESPAVVKELVGTAIDMLSAE